MHELKCPKCGSVFTVDEADYASIVSPEAIIMTGGISHAGPWFFDAFQESFDEHVFSNIKGKVKLLVSELNDREREILGSAALAWEVPEYSLFK